MNTEEMLQEVDRRVANGIMEHLLPKAIERHGKSKTEFRNCDCSYCKTKSKATSDIGNVSYPRDYSIPRNLSLFDSEYEYWEIKNMRRDDLRNHYRAKLKALINE